MNDPLTGTYFTYNVNTAKTAAEIMGYLEGPNNYAYSDSDSNLRFNPLVDTTFASSTPSYASLYPFVKGDTLGIVIANNTGSTDNTPLQVLLGNGGSLDISNATNTTSYQAYTYSNTGVIAGTGLTNV